MRVRVGEVTFEKELGYNYSYFWVRNLGTLLTLATVTTIIVVPHRHLHPTKRSTEPIDRDLFGDLDHHCTGDL